nr:heat shock factor-binding protein isoform X3 [Elaeis guineensis]
MTAFVQNLLVQMTVCSKPGSKQCLKALFQGISFSPLSRKVHLDTDEMGSKIDELEESINDLKAEMGAEGAIKPKPEEPRPPEESA